MEPIRVLQVVTVMNRGGAETMLMNIYRNIDRSKVQFDFLTHRLEEGAYDQEIQELGGRIFRFPPIRPQRYARYFRELDEIFSHHPEYRIVHSHINENSSFVLRAAKKAGVPVRIAHSHTSNLPLDYKLPFRYYGRFFFRENATHCYACSTEAGKWLFKRYAAQNSGVEILKNGVDYDIFKYDHEVRSKLRREMELEDKFVVGHVGRFDKSKNHAFLLEVFKEIHNVRTDSVLLLAGDGYLRPNILKKIEKLGLTGSVRLLGMRSDVARLLQVMDIFLFPSIFEGLPMALVEAQAAGLECIVSDAVSKESDIGAGLVRFVSLKEPPKAWAEKALNVSLNRVDSKEALIKSGFDIVHISRSIQDFYIHNAENYGELGAVDVLPGNAGA